MTDWRKPFLALQENLLPLYQANHRIYHAVCLSPSHAEQNLSFELEWLEPAKIQPPLMLVSSISVSTPGTTYHAHRFYGNDRNGLSQFGRCLHDIEHWFDKLPAGFVRSFQIPRLDNNVHRNLLRWTSLVYYLAW